jgi:cell division protein FtsB
MKKPLAVFMLLLISVLALFAVVQFRTISALRRELTTVRAIAADKEKLAAQVPKLKEENEIFKRESETLRQHAHTTPAPDAAKTAAAEPAKAADPATAANPMAGFKKMLSDPAMKKIMMQQQDSMMRVMYADLGKQLHLDPTKSAELMDLLSQRQGEIFESSLKMGDALTDPKAGEAASGEMDALTKKYEGQLKELLGDQYPAFESYEKTIGDRAIMQQYQQQFATTDYPLTDDQRAGLLQIMADERAQMPKSPFDGSNRNFSDKLQLLNSDEALHDYVASQTELNRRVLDRAGGVLSPEQLTAFANMQKQMLDLQVAGMQMSRAMFKKN